MPEQIRTDLNEAAILTEVVLKFRKVLWIQKARLRNLWGEQHAASMLRILLIAGKPPKGDSGAIDELLHGLQQIAKNLQLSLRIICDWNQHLPLPL